MSAAPRLLLVVDGPREAEADALERSLAAQDRAPRSVDAEALGADSLTRDDVADVPGRRGRILRRLPGPLGLALEAALRARRYDGIISWGEATGWPVALAFALVRPRGRHVAILMHPFDESSPSALKRQLKRRALPVLARRGIDRLLVPAPAQRRRVLERWGVAPDALLDALWAVDTGFWRPMEAEQDTICAVGRELRDYETLVAALRGLDVPCHVAAGTGWRNPAQGTHDERGGRLPDDDLPAGMTVGPLDPPGLRALYARSRFVVVPVVPSASDNGVTTVHEAMAMGRAIVATDTEGRSELLRDGVTCVLVPPRDPEALRVAIRQLWDDPERCARLGAAARELVVEAAGLEQWRAALVGAATPEG